MAAKRCFAIALFSSNVHNGAHCYTLPKPDVISQLWYSEAEAIGEAHILAARHPGSLVILFEAKSVIEAKQPETFAKTWKRNGELIPIEQPVPNQQNRPAFDPVIDVDADGAALDPFAPADLIRNFDFRLAPEEVAEPNEQVNIVPRPARR